MAPTPGTTRDIIEVHLELDGLPVTLLDTAGIREPADAVEAEGVWRARNRAARADLRLLVLDGAAGPEQDGPALELADAHALVVLNKIDLAGIAPETRAPGWRVLRLSCRTGEGIDGLLSALGEAAAARLSGGDGPALTRARHRAALQETAAALARVMEGSTDELALVAEDLRLAARALGRITGRVAVDDLLDRIFSEFCIGK